MAQMPKPEAWFVALTKARKHTPCDRCSGDVRLECNHRSQCMKGDR
jgi:hypothetical protein